MIIGIAGPSASGKTTVAHLLEKEHSAVRMRYSALLSDMARERDLDPDDKETLQELYLSEREKRGEDFLAEEMYERVKLLHPNLLVIEGNRRKVDFQMLKKLAAERGENLLLIFIDASAETRLKRYNERMKRQGDEEVTMEAFEALEANDAENEIQDLKAVVEKEGLYINTDELSEVDTMRKIDTEIDV